MKFLFFCVIFKLLTKYITNRGMVLTMGDNKNITDQDKTSDIHIHHNDEEKPHFHDENGQIHYIEDGDDACMHHEHDHEGHGHIHSHKQTKAVLNRLSRALGHLESVKRMVEDGRDCSEVLIQLAAVQSALNNTGKIILKDHISHCIVDAVKSGDQEELDELYKAIDSFMK